MWLGAQGGHLQSLNATETAMIQRPRKNRVKLDDYWEEQTEWVKGLKNGEHPKYVARLKRRRAIQWDANYYQY